MTTTTTQAIAMRQKLEAEIMRLLVEYQRVTELRPRRVDLQVSHFERVSGGCDDIITGVTVTVEV